jgi:hypothetical protein
MAAVCEDANTLGARSKWTTRTTAICGWIARLQAVLICVLSIHSVKLRQMLIRTHMEELKENTQNVLYERYRSAKLLSMGVTQDSSVFKEVK